MNEQKSLIIKGKYKLKNGEIEIKDEIIDEKKGKIRKKKVSGKIKLGGSKVEVNACIGDDGFKLLSKVIFKDLIEINLSCNGISSVKELDDMLLPHLEYLDLSNNEIVDLHQ